MKEWIFEWLGCLLLNTFLIFGIWKLFEKEMLLGWLGDWMAPKLHEFIRKPLFDCPPCMSSLYGTTFWFLSPLSEWPLHLWPLHCLMLCGLVTVIQGLFHE